MNLMHCPHCGSETAPTVIGENFAYTVHCASDYDAGGCGSTCGYWPTEAEAIENWTRRHRYAYDHMLHEYAKEVCVPWLTLTQLISSHRTLRDEHIRMLQPYQTALKQARQEVATEYENVVTLDALRGMTLTDLIKLLV